MLNNVIDYTISSYDYEHYNRIDANLPGPPTRKSKMIITSLTTKCSIVVIEKDDYIQINNKKYTFNKQYTNINSESFIILLNELIIDTGITVELDECERIIFTSDNQFTINSCSYNILQLSGLYDQILPIPGSYNNETNKYEILAESVGNYISTPILYIVSNLGKSSYRNLNNNLNISKIILRVNNSFSANYPIIVNNADFEVEMNTNDLSHLELTLVDANLHEIHLLNPMYITISISGVIDENIYDNPIGLGSIEHNTPKDVENKQ